MHSFGTHHDASSQALLDLRCEGSFTALSPAFSSQGNRAPQVVQLHRIECFSGQPAARAEALPSAAFLGVLKVLVYLPGANVPPDAGAGTGLDQPAPQREFD